jgi:Glycosyl hydrolases family 43
MAITRRAAFLSAGASALAAGLTAASAAPSQAAPAAAAPTAFPLRLTDMALRDPYVVADAKTDLYHLYVANSPAASGVKGIGTMVYRSRDLEHWSVPQVVFRPPAGLWAAHGGWAPEVHRWKGRWYLFTTVHDEAQPLPAPALGQYGVPAQVPQYARGTIIAVADSLLGPFTVLDPTKPVAPRGFMSLDGTLFADDKGKPWMVYAHEWVQKIDGTMEAVPLKADLSGPAGHPIHLFKGSDATWIADEIPTPSANQLLPYVTDGPQLHRLPGGALAMLWSTYGKTINNSNGMVTGHYVQTYAVSPSGRLKGPWTQRRPLLRTDNGHGMIFTTLPGRKRKPHPMLVLHRGIRTTHAKLYEIELRRDGLRLGKHRKDLDGSS